MFVCLIVCLCCVFVCLCVCVCVCSLFLAGWQGSKAVAPGGSSQQFSLSTTSSQELQTLYDLAWARLHTGVEGAAVQPWREAHGHGIFRSSLQKVEEGPPNQNKRYDCLKSRLCLSGHRPYFAMSSTGVACLDSLGRSWRLHPCCRARPRCSRSQVGHSRARSLRGSFVV